MRKIENAESNRGYCRTDFLEAKMKKSPKQEEACVEKPARVMQF